MKRWHGRTLGLPPPVLEMPCVGPVTRRGGSGVNLHTASLGDSLSADVLGAPCACPEDIPGESLKTRPSGACGKAHK